MSSFLSNLFNLLYNSTSMIKNASIKFHSDVAIADTAFTVKGKTKEILFSNAAKAMISSMADISSIKSTDSREISLSSDKLDTLLFDFLNEILLYKDSENLLFSGFEIDLGYDKDEKLWKLLAQCFGETADPKKHKITTDIKAVTMHMFELNKTKEGYEARVVVDI